LIQKLAQAGLVTRIAAGIHEANDGDALLAKRLQQFCRHGSQRLQVARALVTAARQIVDGDGHRA
jgi:ABC-type Na+ transport system ATPase subunit NatA